MSEEKKEETNSSEEEKKELELEKPKVETQDDKKPDPDKKGLSEADKAELETLRTEKVNLEKRLSDTQEKFHANTKEFNKLQARVDFITAPENKGQDKYPDDPMIKQLNAKIESYKGTYDTEPLKVQKQLRNDALDARIELKKLQDRAKDDDSVGKFLMDNPGVKDLTPAGKAKAELAGKGVSVDLETAHFYNLGKNQEEVIEAEVKKRLEAADKAGGARGHGDGNLPEPKEADQEEKDYADSLTDPSGLDLQ